MRSIDRSFLALVAVSLVGLPLAHGLALLLRLMLPEPAVAEAAGALPLSAAVVATSLVAAVAHWRGAHASVAGALAGLVAGAALALGAGALAAGGAALLLGAVGGWAVGRVAERLPADLDGVSRRRPVAAALWVVLALAAIGQGGRIATFMTDDTFAAGPTIPDYFAHHMCLPAYLQAAELNDAGEENIYAPAHYPGLCRDAAPATAVPGMDKYLEDPFQYPPVFLLVSELALAVGPDFDAIRTGWFVLQALVFAVLALAIARWVGGAAGRRALFLFPLVWLAPATNFNFQYGQFHLIVVMVAIAGLVAVERGRDAVGGGLLAFAALTKLFPGLLLLMLITRRKWRALGWAAVSGVALVALSVAVVGTQPWVAFFNHHIPALADGSAFAFDTAWPEMRSILVAGNQSPIGLVHKLVDLGFAGAIAWQPFLSVAYLAGIALVAALAGLRRGTRAQYVATGLALLSLASMQSGGAWAEYITVSLLWMLTFVATGTGRLAGIAAVATWVWFLVLPGSVPPIFWEGAVPIVLSLVGLVFAVVLSVRGALPSRRGTSVALAVERGPGLGGRVPA